MTIVIVIVTILVIGGIYMFGMQKMKNPKIGEAYAEAQKEIEENYPKLRDEYFADENRYGFFKNVVSDENIIGLTTVLPPASLGKAAMEGLKTSITRVKKVDMSLYYFVITDQHLHWIQSNGENSTQHLVFDLDQIQNVTISKAGGVKDQMAGVTGQHMFKLKFNYKGTDYEYNVEDYVAGYPVFDVQKNFADNGFDRIYKYSAIEKGGYKAMMSKEYQVDIAVRGKIYQEFKTAFEKRFNVTIPDMNTGKFGQMGR